MWNLKQIPKVMYLYWGRNKPLSYMRFKTVESFVKKNKDWKVVVYYPTNFCANETWDTNEQKQHDHLVPDHFHYLSEFSNVEVKSFDMGGIGFSNDMPEVYKSDIIRLYLLKEFGGFWSDFDIFYTKSMNCLSFNKRENSIYETFICDHYGFNSVGFLAATKGSQFFEDLYKFAKREIDANGYQTYGRDLFRKVLNIWKIDEEDEKSFENNLIYNVPYETVYPYSWHHTDVIFGNNLDIPFKSIGIHWYAGSGEAAKVESELKENINLPLIQMMENIQPIKLGIGLPLKNEFVNTSFLDSFVRMKKPNNYVYLRPTYPNENIDGIRNQLVEGAIESGCDFLLMLDTDQDYPVDLIERMFAHDKDIVGAAIVRRYPDYDRIAYRGILGRYVKIPEEELDSTPLIEVDNTGAGCLLINMEVFHHVEKPWFKFDLGPEGKPVGEDVGFLSRAKQAGYKIFLDTTLDVGHMTTMRLDRNFSKLYKRLIEIGGR